MEGVGRKRRRIRFKSVVVYIVLILLTFLCLFPFYILIINSTRYHPEIQQGFPLFPEKLLCIILRTLCMMQICLY